MLYFIFILIGNWKSEYHCLYFHLCWLFNQMINHLVELNRSQIKWMKHKHKLFIQFYFVSCLSFSWFDTLATRHSALGTRFSTHSCKKNSCCKTWHSKIRSDLDIGSELIKVNVCAFGIHSPTRYENLPINFVSTKCYSMM